jgi:hypothetical protein
VFVAVLVLAGAGFATSLVVRCFISSPRAIVLAGIGAVGATAVLVVSLFFVSFGECLAENREQPLSWPWSPRRQFCNAPSSHASVGAYALFLLPSLLIIVGTILAKRGPRLSSWPIFALLLVVPFLPGIYVDSLPIYRLDDYPILHAPLLRQAVNGQPARVCYAYGIVFGPRKEPVTDDTERTCVDLLPTRQALALTPAYDEGRTIYDLEWMGKNLTGRGLPVRPGGTGIDGLVVKRVYKLSGRKALEGSTAISAI